MYVLGLIVPIDGQQRVTTMSLLLIEIYHIIINIRQEKGFITIIGGILCLFHNWIFIIIE